MTVVFAIAVNPASITPTNRLGIFMYSVAKRMRTGTGSGVAQTADPAYGAEWVLDRRESFNTEMVANTAGTILIQGGFKGDTATTNTVARVSTNSGSSWTALSSPGGSNPVALGSNGTVFVAVYASGDIYTSQTPQTYGSWALRFNGTATPLTGEEFDNGYTTVNYANSTFVVTAGKLTIYTSSDAGVTWTKRKLLPNIPDDLTNEDLYQSVWDANNSQWLFVSVPWTNQGRRLLTTDGSFTASSIKMHNADHVALAYNYTTGAAVALCRYSNFNGYDGNYCAVRAASSLSGLKTTVVTNLSIDLVDLIYGEGLYIGVKSNGNIVSSTDGVTGWIDRSITSQNKKLFYLNGNFFALGAGSLRSSADGITWTTRSMTLGGTYTSITHGGGRYYIVNTSGAVYSCPDTDLNSWSSWLTSSGHSGTVYALRQFSGSVYILGEHSGNSFTVNFATYPATSLTTVLTQSYTGSIPDCHPNLLRGDTGLYCTYLADEKCNPTRIYHTLNGTTWTLSGLTTEKDLNLTNTTDTNPAVSRGSLSTRLYYTTGVGAGTVVSVGNNGGVWTFNGDSGSTSPVYQNSYSVSGHSLETFCLEYLTDTGEIVLSAHVGYYHGEDLLGNMHHHTTIRNNSDTGSLVDLTGPTMSVARNTTTNAGYIMVVDGKVGSNLQVMCIGTTLANLYNKSTTYHQAVYYSPVKCVGDQVWCIAEGRGVIVSNDEGLTWAPAATDLSHGEVSAIALIDVFKFGSYFHLLGGCNLTARRSDLEVGSNWTITYGATYPPVAMNHATSINEFSYLVAAGSEGTYSLFFEYYTETAQPEWAVWSNFSISEPSHRQFKCATHYVTDPGAGSAVIAGDQAAVYRYNASSWLAGTLPGQITSSTNFTSIASTKTPSSTLVLVADDGTILRSTDGDTWSLIATGTYWWRSVVYDGSHFVIGGYRLSDNRKTSAVSSDGGLTWTYYVDSNPTRTSSIRNLCVDTSVNRIWSVCGSALQYSTDHGVSWSDYAGPNIYGSPLSDGAFYHDPTTGFLGFLNSDGSHVFNSSRSSHTYHSLDNFGFGFVYGFYGRVYGTDGIYDTHVPSVITTDPQSNAFGRRAYAITLASAYSSTFGTKPLYLGFSVHYTPDN
jgi:hypothetical protein